MMTDGLRCCQHALNDHDQAIELDPKEASVHVSRAIAYGILGNEDMVISNLIDAARLGHKKTRHYLSAKGIEWQLNKGHR